MGSKSNQTTETIDLCDSDEEASQEVITLDDSCSFINHKASRMSLRDNKRGLSIKTSSPSKKSAPFKFNQNSDDKDVEIVAVQLASRPPKTPKVTPKNFILRRRSGGSGGNSRLFGGGSGNIIKPKLQGIQKKGKSPKKKRKKRGRQSDPFFSIKQLTPQKTAQHKVSQARKILQNRQQKQDTAVQSVGRNLRRHQNDDIVSISRNRKGKPNPFTQKVNLKFRFAPATSVPLRPVSSDLPDYVPWRICTSPTSTSEFPNDDDSSKKVPRRPVAPSTAVSTVIDPNGVQPTIVDCVTIPTSTTSSLLPTTTPASRIVTRKETREGDSFKITAIINNNNVSNKSDHTPTTTTNLPPQLSLVSQSHSSKQQQQQQQHDPASDTPLSIYGSNLYYSKPAEAKTKGSLRPIVIDGSNIAMGHGNHKFFSCRGIQICCEFFTGRGHSVYAFVPRFRLKHSQSKDPKILDQLERQGICKFTASREVRGERIASYDDRYIVQVAADMDGVIVSNDNFKDLYEEQPLWRETIRNRVLQYTWVSEDCLMFPHDPLGAQGPTLEQFLRF